MADIWNVPTPEKPEGATTPEQPAAPTPDATPAQEQKGETNPPVNAGNTTPPPSTERPVPPYYAPPGQQPPYRPAGGYGWVPPAGGQPPVNGGGKPPKKGKGWVAVVAVLGALAVLACIVLVAFSVLRAIDFEQVPYSDGVPSENVNENTPALEISKWDDDDGGLSTKEVVNRNLDSTVVLSIYKQSTQFNFGESTLTEQGGASGIIMSSDGYIITNWHCVTDEETGKYYDRVDVTTHDGKTYEDAKVIGADESTDLAVIKINASGLSVASFGDSAELAVGDRVVALGNAAGLSWTATQGIVSALARDVYDDTGYAIKCLQVDAAINPGNSGGPLLNNQGMVVGINSSKIAASGYEGLGFSIPINEAKGIIDSLLKNGYVKGRVALGITGQTVSSGMYNGFMIATISSGSCLEGTEAQVGDLIVAVDNTVVKDYGALRAELAKHAVGDKITLKLLRSNRTGQVTSHFVTVTLKEQVGN